MRVAVTGISSYLARTLFPLMEKEADIEEVRGLDVKEPDFSSDKLKFMKCDVRDPAINEHINGCDALVHLAFIVMPIRDEKLADDINVNGSKNVFKAAAEAGIKKVVHLSSIAAYGAWPDNPELITEDVPVRGMPSVYYSRSKAAVEKFLDQFEIEHPDMVITRLRPTIFVGPSIDNAVTSLVGAKVLVSIKGLDSRIQLTWDEDVAEAIMLALKGDFHGAYNLGGGGSLTMEEFAQVLGVRCIDVPYGVLYWLSKIGWALRISPLNAAWVELTQYPILVSARKAKKEMGWKPTCDTKQALTRLIESLPVR